MQLIAATKLLRLWAIILDQSFLLLVWKLELFQHNFGQIPASDSRKCAHPFLAKGLCFFFYFKIERERNKMLVFKKWPQISCIRYVPEIKVVAFKSSRRVLFCWTEGKILSKLQTAVLICSVSARDECVLYACVCKRTSAPCCTYLNFYCLFLLLHFDKFVFPGSLWGHSSICCYLCPQ